MLLGNGLAAHRVPLSLLGLAWQAQVRDEAWPSLTFGGFANTTAIPSGYGMGPSLVKPVRAGALGSHRWAAGTATAALTLAAGRNLAGESAGTSAADASLQLIVSMQGSADGLATVTGNIVAALGLSGLASASSGASATAGALAWAAGEAAGMSAASLVSYATGRLAGSITPYTDLSPEALAAAVWNSSLAGYQEDGSAGKALSTAGAGGVDLGALADAVRTELGVELAAVIDLWRRHGLDIAAPLTQTTSAITAGSLSLAVTGDPDTSVTVTRTA